MLRRRLTELFEYTLLDLALAILFATGITVFGFALYQESKEKAPMYTVLMTAGTMIVFVATFVAAIRR